MTADLILGINANNADANREKLSSIMRKFHWHSLFLSFSTQNYLAIVKQ